MRINNLQNTYNTSKGKSQNISHKGAREVLRTIANPDSLASTVLLETAVTGGRGYNAYKRGGINELRERAVDDVVAAVFWMKGVDIFNKLGDKFGQKVLKLADVDFDMGKDALRTPFKNRVADLNKLGVKPENVKKVEKKLATFKFSKIILSTILSTAFVGFALPRITQGMTKIFMKKNKEEQTQQQEKKKGVDKDVAISAFAHLTSISFEEFSKKLGGKENTSFKGLLSPDLMTTVVHYLENNKVCKLLSSDVGITTGRVTSARNKDEGLEYLFRDTASSFFYIASTPLIYSGLQKITKSKGLTGIDPVATKQIYELCLEQLKNTDSMSVGEFSKRLLGSLDEAAEAIINKLPFGKSNVISLDKLFEFVDDVNLREKARQLAELQPKQAGLGAVLTKQQVADVFKGGAISDPKFMKSIFGKKFGKDLTNPYKYIPMKKITTFRDGIDDYARAVIEAAKKKNNGLVDKKLLDKLNKKSFAMSAGFRAVAIGISALALGVAIPKIQYAITAKRTGSNAAPGLREYEQTVENKEQKVEKEVKQ